VDSCRFSSFPQELLSAHSGRTFALSSFRFAFLLFFFFFFVKFRICNIDSQPPLLKLTSKSDLPDMLAHFDLPLDHP